MVGFGLEGDIAGFAPGSVADSRGVAAASAELGADSSCLGASSVGSTTGCAADVAAGATGSASGFTAAREARAAGVWPAAF